MCEFVTLTYNQNKMSDFAPVTESPPIVAMPVPDEEVQPLFSAVQLGQSLTLSGSLMRVSHFSPLSKSCAAISMMKSFFLEPPAAWQSIDIIHIPKGWWRSFVAMMCHLDQVDNGSGPYL